MMCSCRYACIACIGVLYQTLPPYSRHMYADAALHARKYSVPDQQVCMAIQCLHTDRNPALPQSS